MKDTLLTRFVKLFVATMTALILVLAAFGLGVSVGLHNQKAASPAPETPAQTCRCEASEADNPAGAISPTQAEAPAASAIPTPTPRPVQLTPKPTATPVPPTNSASNPLDAALFKEVWDLLQQQFYGDLPQGQEVTYAAIRGLIESLGDQYTAFEDPKAAALMSDMEGYFEGIGAQVELAEGGGVLLKYLYPGQPAELAGLLVGDIVTAVDGRDITKLSLSDAIGLIRGPRDSRVVLTIRRESQPDFDVTVVRARIEIQVVKTQTLADGKVAYIALAQFSAIAPDRLSEALSQVLASNPKGLILDLRGNPGGFLNAAVDIGSYFVPKGNILIERFKDGTERSYARQGRYLLGDTPLVVLVDGGSASAAEIVAGAIQDAGTGVLIGEKTYGKGSVQLVNTLSDKSQLRVTVAHWFTPKDRMIHGAGLQPDIVVPLTKEDAAAKRDPQLDRAVDYLLQGK